MTSSHSLLSARSVPGLVLLSAFLALLGGCTSIPAELRVQGPVVGRVHAKGSQIYTCEQDGGNPCATDETHDFRHAVLLLSCHVGRLSPRALRVPQM